MAVNMPKSKDSFIELTTTRAKKFLRWNTFKGQRPPDSDTVADIENKLKKGKWHLGNVAVAINGDKTVLVNGQQTCMAVIRTGITCKCVLQEFRTKTKDQIALVFSQFDTHRSRSPGNLAWAYATAHGLPATIPHQCVRLMIPAIETLESGRQRIYSRRISRDVRAGKIKQYLAETAWVAQLLWPSGRKKSRDTQAIKHLRRAQVIAVMLATYQQNKAEAQRFWVGVRDGAGRKRSDPALQLRDWLRGIARIRYAINPRVEAKTMTTSHEVQCTCILHWNASRTGEKVAKYKVGMETPEVE